MEPVITTAIVAALTNLSTYVIKDSYDALKTLLEKKFGAKSNLVNAIKKLEELPDRDDRKATLKTEIEIAKVNNDPEILQLAQDLLNKLKEQPGGQAAINQIQNNQADNNDVQGDFNFSSSQKA